MASLLYQPIDQHDDHKLDGDALQRPGGSHRRVSLSWPVLSFLLFMCVTLTIVAFVAVVTSFGSSSCAKPNSQPSPVTQDLILDYHEQWFNGSLLKENVYRLPASPEVDVAWEALGVNCAWRDDENIRSNSDLTNVIDRSAVVTEDIAKSVGLRRDQVKISQEFGGGYPANVEGLHHLHCLVSALFCCLTRCSQRLIQRRIFFAKLSTSTSIITTLKGKVLFKISNTFCKSTSVSQCFDYAGLYSELTCYR